MWVMPFSRRRCKLVLAWNGPRKRFGSTGCASRRISYLGLALCASFEQAKSWDRADEESGRPQGS